MIVTATEFKLNLGKYLALAETEDILISKNGKVSVKLVNNNQDRVEAMQSLFGCIPADITSEEAREERLNKI
ncbi:MAG: type II toxin-antitoxin system Phd/YefM family antitoxin [Ruminococcus sp.]|nr:type II toxin-antitoxin system Phd/YefM family antitoxin [Ruminococcus sp.]MCD7727067.1 type II toxin-antitoxin system Phd/YefM family antitoxin [Ruminococcus sp.]MCD7772654.1 type II toxin-antitoxin system Phd/YefM family antitoxin [Ruminococcus sp.]